MFAPAGVPEAIGAVDGVQVPAARVSMSPCSTPDSRAKPVATQSVASVHATEVSCTSVEGPPSPVATGSPSTLPPDSVSRRPS